MNRIGGLIDRLRCILDSDEDKWGGALYGLPIVSPDHLKTMDADKTLVVIVVAGSAVIDVHKQILAMGDYAIMAARILIQPVLSAVAETFYTHQSELKQVSELLYDNFSKNIYHEVVRRRALYGECDFSDLVRRSDVEYCPALWFCSDRPENEIILDCGAYEGDTLARFTKIYGPAVKRIYSFECMPQSLRKLKEVAATLTTLNDTPEVVILPYALSDYIGKTTFMAIPSRPGGSFISDGLPTARLAYYAKEEVEVDVSTIDALIPKDEKVTQIKMDIEGGEYAALLGARETILRCKPKLAISLYHSGEDYYRLPLLIKEMVPEYKIAVRHHHKRHVDTDMYCWI